MEKYNKKQYKKNRLQITRPTWNSEFELPDVFCSVSDIQGYIEHVFKRHKTLTTIPPIHVYINRMNNRLVFKIKDEYKLQLQLPKPKKLFDSAKEKNK